MLFSKNTINSKEWMDVIFADRNKEYGAYQLRQYSSKATNIALIIVLGTVGGLCSLSFMNNKIEDVIDLNRNSEEVTEVMIIDIDEPVIKEPVIEKDNSSAQVAQDISVMDVVKFTDINPTSKPSTEDVVAVSEAMDKKAVLGSINMKGAKGGELIPRGTFGTTKRDGGATGRLVGDLDESSDMNKPFEVVEVMPMPPGGMDAFVKWVGLNYRFSDNAVQNEAKGLVQINFVVEKDGTLSSFEVKRDIGFGTGEEAIRLLQKAKKWSPGIQNGIPVRVSYTLPIRLSTIVQ